MQLKYIKSFAGILLCAFCLNNLAQASGTSQAPLPKGIHYEKQIEKNHVIHIVTVDPALYRFELVKARNQVFGRETVEAMALRKNAIVAINGGFFEIGNMIDGHPSGTLIINKNIFSLKKGLSALFAWNDKNFYIGKTVISLELIGQKKNIFPDKINQFIKAEETALYTDVWGPVSLTPYHRKEFLFNHEGKIIEVLNHGDNPIPQEGWLLSVPSSSLIASSLFAGEKFSLTLNFEKNKEEGGPQWEEYQNFVMGIPLLVQNGKLVPRLEHAGGKGFVMMPHARTAVGIRKDGKIVLVVAEHRYNQSLSEMSLEQAQALLRSKGHALADIEKMSLAQAKAILKAHFSQPSCIGLNLLELAILMMHQGCISAINLDGGGSSTLFLNGDIVNTPFGDEDESKGQQMLRPVSDAIVIIKRQNS